MGFLPVLVFVLVLIPLLAFAFRSVRRTKQSAERPADAATQARIDDEFAAAEAYQEEWRAEERKHQRDTIV